MKKYITFLAKEIKINFFKRKIKRFNQELSIYEINVKYKERNTIYKYYHHYFWNLSPVWLKDHRYYFSKEQRAFGEDAFHAMWYLF